MSLTPKKKAFIDAYLVDRNATKAAITAGYSKKTAYSAGGRLLKDVEVAALLNTKLNKISEQAGITAAEVLAGLKLEANGLGEDSNISGRVAAWGLLGKHLKMFVDKTEVTGPDGGPLQVSVNINLGDE